MITNREIIGVVGGGSVSISFLSQLIDEVIIARMNDGIDIIIFEPQENVGPGYAYQSDVDCNLLNTRADTMSVMASDKKHFLQWLLGNEFLWRKKFPDLSISDGAFLPRSLFGIYLESVYSKFLDKAGNAKIPVRRITGKVIDVESLSENSFQVLTESCGEFTVNRVVLCTGNLPSMSIKNCEGRNNYFNSPYPGMLLTKEVSKSGSVCIVGTSLSAIDAVLSLKDAGHTGKIVCVSRNGRLPSVRGNSNSQYTLQKLTKKWVDELCSENNGFLPLEMVIKQLAHEYEFATGRVLNINEILMSNLNMKEYISEEVRKAVNDDRHWQSIIYAMNPIVDYLWHHMSHNDKDIFNKHFKSLWLAYRVSFPLKNAIKIKSMLDSEQLEVFGGVGEVSIINSKFLIVAKSGNLNESLCFTSDYLINATSFSVDVNATEDKLIRSLIGRGIAHPHEHGGFVVDYETGCLLGGDGRMNKNISALGSLTVGTYFWTNAMDVNARLARQQVGYILSQVAANRKELVEEQQLVIENGFDF